MSYNDPSCVISDFEKNCTRLIYRLPRNGDYRPNLDAYFIGEGGLSVSQLKVVDASWNGSVNEIHLREPLRVLALTNEFGSTSLRRETNVKVYNSKAPDSKLSLPLLEVFPNSKKFRGIAPTDSADNGYHNTVVASVGDTLIISDINEILQIKILVREPLPTSVDQIASEELPKAFTVLNNYPNPFNPETNIQYALPIEAKVMLRIFNLLGKEVRVIDEGTKPTGKHIVKWDGKNDHSENVASGVYFYQVSFFPNGDSKVTITQVGKMILLQ
jgi:hypothetical protein